MISLSSLSLISDFSNASPDDSPVRVSNLLLQRVINARAIVLVLILYQNAVIVVSLGLIVSTIINVSLLVILCIGFTFTYMMEKFPNFAHTSYASLGTMVTYYLVKFYGFNPYYTWPISAVLGGLLGVILYVLIVKPIKDRAFSEITLTFTFYIISQIITQGLAIFSYWLLVDNRIQSQGFNLYNYDFRVNGVPAIAIIAPLTVFGVVVAATGFLETVKARDRYEGHDGG